MGIFFSRPQLGSNLQNCVELSKEYKLKSLMDNHDRVAFGTCTGSFGRQTFKAKHRDTKRKVTIDIFVRKFYPHQYIFQNISDSDLKTLTHPNLCEFIERIENPEIICFISQYHSKDSLLYELKWRENAGELSLDPIPLETYVGWRFGEIIEAVNYLHQSGFAHTDLREENITCQGNGSLKIGALQYCVKVTSANMLGDVKPKCSSLAHTAPELIEEVDGECRIKANVGCVDLLKADMYSMGVILYRMCTNELPLCYNSKHKATFYQPIKQGVYHRPNSVPDQIHLLLRNLLEPNPELRCSSPELLEFPLFKK